MRRTIIIGDVHGCPDELRDLLRTLDVSPEDRLISVGDLICKGPDSAAVLDWAMSAKNLRCILGNHEYRFLLNWKSKMIPQEKPYDLETYRQLEGNFERYMKFIASWPLSIETEDFLVVHAGFDPRIPLEKQSVWNLTNIRRIEGTQIPWYEEYAGKKLVVFGHWAKRELVQRSNAIGLDTGCVYGGSLSALVLPERRIVSVPARKAYWKKDSWQKNLAAS